MLLIFSGILSFLWNRKHILMMLISLEILMMGLFSMFYIFLLNEMFEMILIFMVLMVCEACLGLSMLILTIFFYNNDFPNNMKMLNF
ncbi:NADH dehydrogenase subunit 4L (mitochondrion) [Varroa destructor]|nr:NADH dehydrogenase subunit 4L [Varroa destructor]BBI76493.1 NADH dehydrogenase subunit 4L [Varroa destructor]CAD38002.1 NADH dehydrogenase subunit 4L [Varroa destructor]